jgi:glycolate oxidase
VAVIPVPGCIVLCTIQMNQILELDAANLTMLVEPGVLTEEIALRAGTVGLFYPPDPRSMKISTIGGNVAEDSGGLRGLKYGVTRDYVKGSGKPAQDLLIFARHLGQDTSTRPVRPN